MSGPTRTSGLSCFAFAAAVAATGIAFSQPACAGEPPMKVPYWTGFYAGVHGGWGWGTTDIYDPMFQTVFNPTEVKYNGPLAGGQLGYNWQQGNFVVGAEVDGSWTFARGNSSANQGVISSTTNSLFSYRAIATGTGRIGYAMNQWLAYAKGGVAWADMEIVAKYMVQPTTYDRSMIGATAGAGLEVAFLRNVSAKAEYNYIWLPVDHLVYANINSISSLEHHIHVVKFGINVRLGGHAGLPR